MQMRRDPRNKSPTKVLWCEVSNVKYPVTVDVIKQVFEKHGNVEKIVVFTRHENPHAFVQLDSVQKAMNAKQLLDGRHIYSQCNRLSVNWSGLQELTVRPGDENSADFTLSAPILQTPPSSSGGGPVRNRPMPSSYQGHDRDPPSRPYPRPASTISPRLENYDADRDDYQRRPPRQASPPPTHRLQRPPISQGQREGEGSHRLQQSQGSGCVVSVTNVSADTSPHDLFVLLGVYGDVLRVKMSYKRSDEAFVQFRNPDGARAAETNLTGCFLHGKELQIRVNRMPEVILPPPNAAEEDKAKAGDYTESRLHRFRYEGSQNFRNICAPSKQLHVANLPPTADETIVGRFFERVAPPLRVAMFPPRDNTTKQMALVEFNDVDSAVHALVALHGEPIDGCNVRISFSRKSCDDVKNKERDPP
eukprot:RCo039931